jgi:hypothetical protein
VNAMMPPGHELAFAVAIGLAAASARAEGADPTERMNAGLGVQVGG